MKKQDFNLHIIGAGFRGPIGANVIEDNGFSPELLNVAEKTSQFLIRNILNRSSGIPISVLGLILMMV